VLDLAADRCRLVLQLETISEREAASFQTEEDFQFALFTAEGILFFLLDVPGVIEWSDAPYTLATLRPALWPAKQPDGTPIALTVALIERKTRLIRGLREFRLTRAFSDALHAQIARQRENPLSAPDALKKIRTLQKKHTPEQMAAKAAARFPALT
jgi:hypothetical protein